MKTKNKNYFNSKKFIIDFLASIEQPLNEKQINDILAGSKYLDKLLKEQELKLNQEKMA